MYTHADAAVVMVTMVAVEIAKAASAVMVAADAIKIEKTNAGFCYEDSDSNPELEYQRLSGQVPARTPCFRQVS
jgi:hypothetical protein